MRGDLQGVLAGAVSAGLLLLLLRWAGLFRWWRRRRYLAQLLLLVTFPLPVVMIVLAVGLLLSLPIDYVGGLLMGSVWMVVAPLLATSHLVRRVRGIDQIDERDEYPNR